MVQRSKEEWRALIAERQISANLYSLIETAKACGLNPYDYLKRVFTELPNANTLEDVDILLPWVKPILDDGKASA